MSTEIVAMTEAHWPQVSAIYAEGIATGHATFDPAPPDWAGFDTSRLADHRWVGLDAESGDVLGWVAVSPVSARPVYAGVVEHSIYVAAAARGRGVGRALLEALITSTEAAGIWTVQSGVFGENRASIALHEAVGFRAVGHRVRVGRMTYGPQAGRWRDVILMERRSDVVG